MRPRASAAAAAIIPGTAATAITLEAVVLAELDPVAVRAVLSHPDPVAAGIAAAAREARALLAIPGVAGVNISGLASARGYEFGARVKAELAQLIRAGGGHDH